MIYRLYRIDIFSFVFLLDSQENFSGSLGLEGYIIETVRCIRILKEISFWINYLEYTEEKISENGAEENTNHTHNGWEEPAGKWNFNLLNWLSDF